MKNIPYGRQWIDSADIAEVAKVLKSDIITRGQKTEEFENMLARYCGVKYAVAVSSGTAALHLACLAAGLKKGDEAITSPITFVATPNSVLYAGAKPVFADVDNETGNINPTEIEKQIASKTKAILPVHFSGLPCDMPAIKKIANKNRLKIIEDACHALGAKYKYKGKWIKVGSCAHSDITTFSFHPVKHITTGEGGAITTNNKKLYEKLCALRTHGVYKSPQVESQKGSWYYEMKDLGFNYRMTDFQSALGLSQLKKLDDFIKRRREIAKIYGEKFRNNVFFDLPVEGANFKSSWHLYAIRLKNKYIKRKKEIFKKLRDLGIGAQVHYIPVYWQPFYEGLGYKRGLCVNAEEFYAREVSLPVFFSLREGQINYATNKVKSILLK